MKVSMSWVNIPPDAKKAVNEVLNSGWLSRHKYIPRFEKEFARLHGAKFGVFMNSGTDALRISLATLKESYKWNDGDEVIVPALTFPATVNVVLQNNLKPVFCDIFLGDFNIDYAKIPGLRTKKTKAILPVHLFGLPTQVPVLYYDLCFVEDSCETVGVHKLRGDMAAFSFYSSHHIQCGMGGMMLTNNDILEKIARSLMNHGRTDDGSHFKFGRIGYSARATEMEAAIGCAALKTWPQQLKTRQRLASQYCNNLAPGSLISYSIRDSSWMFFPLLVSNRDGLLKYLRHHGIESREAMPLTNQPVYRKLYRQGSCPQAEHAARHGILLPLHPLMSESDVDYVCAKVRSSECL